MKLNETYRITEMAALSQEERRLVADFLESCMQVEAVLKKSGATSSAIQLKKLAQEIERDTGVESAVPKAIP